MLSERVLLPAFAELGKKVPSSASKCVSCSVSISESVKWLFSIIILFIAIAGMAKKVSLEEGWLFFPQDALDKHISTGVRPSRYDFTLMSEGEKGWTTGKE